MIGNLLIIGAIGILVIEFLSFLMRYLRGKIGAGEWAIALIMIPTAVVIMGIFGVIASIILVFILPKSSVPTFWLTILPGLFLFIFVSRKYSQPTEYESVSHQIELEHYMRLRFDSDMPRSIRWLDKLLHRSPGNETVKPEKYGLYMKFYSLRDLGTDEKAKEFFHLLIEENEAFIPDRYHRIWKTELKGKRFDRNNLDDAVRIWISHTNSPYYYSSTIRMRREKPFHIWIVVCWNRGPHALFNEIAIWIGEEYLSMDYGTKPLLSLGESLYNYTGGLYGFITRYDLKAAHFLSERLNFNLPGIFWAQFLGPQYIDFFEEERIKNAPCYLRKTLPDGGVLLQTAEFPTGLEAPADRESENILRDNLDHDAFFDASQTLGTSSRRRQLGKNTPLFDFCEVRIGRGKV